MTTKPEVPTVTTQQTIADRAAGLRTRFKTGPISELSASQPPTTQPVLTPELPTPQAELTQPAIRKPSAEELIAAFEKEFDESTAGRMFRTWLKDHKKEVLVRVTRAHEIQLKYEFLKLILQLEDAAEAIESQ